MRDSEDAAGENVGGKPRRMRTALRVLGPFILLTTLVSCDPAGWSYPTGCDSFTAAQGYDTSGCTAFLNAAAVSLQSSKNDKAANLTSIASMVARVMADHPGYVFIADPTGTVHDPTAGPGSYSWMRMGVRP
jgi:hypothetical protein